MTTVRVPASSANLGAGFDAVALALDLHLTVTDGGDDPAPERHPAVRAHRAAGGDGTVAVRANFPGGRGLGYSGAARVGGALHALADRGETDEGARRTALDVAAEAEGHVENAAASLYGGVVVAAGGHVVVVPQSLELTVVLWIPQTESSTRKSRGSLPETVPFADAVHNVGRSSLLVAALAAGDAQALGAATDDRLHQDVRLDRLPESRRALEAMTAHGAFAAWLSGSGPTIAGLALPESAGRVAAALPETGRSEIVAFDPHGAVIV